MSPPTYLQKSDKSNTLERPPQNLTPTSSGGGWCCGSDDECYGGGEDFPIKKPTLKTYANKNTDKQDDIHVIPSLGY